MFGFHEMKLTCAKNVSVCMVSGKTRLKQRYTPLHTVIIMQLKLFHNCRTFSRWRTTIKAPFLCFNATFYFQIFFQDFVLCSYTVNSEINACIYYCDSLTIVQNVSLIIAISVNFVTKGYQEKSKC